MKIFSTLTPESLPRYIACYTMIFFMMFLDIQVLPLMFELPVYTVFFLPTIYYWAIYRPTIIPPWLLFLFGLLKDLFMAYPYIGLSSAVYIIAYILTKQQRSYLSGQYFIMVWAGYCLVAVTSMFIYFVAHYLYLFSTKEVFAFLLEAIFMIIIFPLTLPTLGTIQRALPRSTYRANL